MGQELTCVYGALYFNYERQVHEVYRCPENRLAGQDVCVFHSENPQVNGEEFMQLVNNRIIHARNNNQPIYCIGWIFHFAFNFQPEGGGIIYTPDLEPDQHDPDLHIPIYFSYSKIRGNFQATNYHFRAAYFDDVTFEGEVSIGFSLFEKCTFKNSTFKNMSNFSMVKMIDADFSMSIFEKSAKFTGAQICKCSFFASRFAEIANFATVHFNGKTDLSNIKFNGEVTFSGSKFLDLTYFHYSIFQERANFEGVLFKKRTNFNNVVFEYGEKVIFNSSNLSMLSFKHTDITRVNFGDVQWRAGKKYMIIDEQDLEWSFKPIIDWNYMRTHLLDKGDNLYGFLRYNGVIENETLLTRKEEEKIAILKKELNNEVKIGEIFLIEDGKKVQINVSSSSFIFELKNKKHHVYYPLKINLYSVLSIYRNLRENYEYRLRYEEAGKFFLREMEVKRKYYEVFKNNLMNYYEGYDVILKNRLTQSFSLTGIYYHISRYGESVAFPAMLGSIILLISTLIFVTELNPLNEYSIYNYIGFNQAGNSTHWLKSIERSSIDFIPLINTNTNFELGAIDYVIKTLAGALTFGFIAIALKRKFERKIRH